MSKKICKSCQISIIPNIKNLCVKCYFNQREWNAQEKELIAWFKQKVTSLPLEAQTKWLPFIAYIDKGPSTPKALSGELITGLIYLQKINKVEVTEAHKHKKS